MRGVIVRHLAMPDGPDETGETERAQQGVDDGFGAIKFDIDHSADEFQHDPRDRGLSQAGRCLISLDR